MGSQIKKYSAMFYELEGLIGEESAMKILMRYRGQTLSFPMRLLSPEYIKAFIKDNIGKMSTRDMANELGLSERRIRQVKAELKMNC